jgi:hypothetical protein
VRTPEFEQQVGANVRHNPTTSIRRIAHELNASTTTVQRVLRKDLKLYPYKMEVVQDLSDEDRATRVQFAMDMLETMDGDPDFLSHIMFSDEANFDLVGNVNKQNIRYWATDPPTDFFKEVPLHPPLVEVWMAVGSPGRVGPFFFDNITVNKERYLEMLETRVEPVLREFDNFDQIVFQQDGASAHFGGIPWLRRNFPARWVGRGLVRYPAPYAWPPRSPDLTVCDFFWWGYLKAKVYPPKKTYRTLTELKAAIIRAAQEVPQEMIDAAVSDFRHCMEMVIEREGGHIETRPP